MSIKINGEEKQIGLALSGGGFRAACFHLGVFRKLNKLNLLWKLDLLSCVSGGSIAGAFIASRWGDNKCLDSLETYLAEKSIVISSVLWGIFSPFSSRVDKLADSYKKDLYGKKILDDLKNGPRIYLNATNLVTGNLFSFVAGRGEDSEIGDYELGFVTAPKFPIYRAVAASSAFPPVFNPLQIDIKYYNPPRQKVKFNYVTLTDGGVYDNMGINPLMLTNRNPLDYAIISDGGKPFEDTQKPTRSGLKVLREAISIQMEQIRGLEFQRIKYAHYSGNGPKPLWFSIDSQNGEAQKGDAAEASAVGTNLKKLSKVEREVLIRQGGALVEARLKSYAPELLS